MDTFNLNDYEANQGKTKDWAQMSTVRVWEQRDERMIDSLVWEMRDRHNEAAEECGWVSREGSEGCWVCQAVFSQTYRCPLRLTLFYGSFTALAYCSCLDCLLQGSAPLANPSCKPQVGSAGLWTPNISPLPDLSLIHTRSNGSSLFFRHSFRLTSVWPSLSHTLIHQDSGQCLSVKREQVFPILCALV